MNTTLLLPELHPTSPGTAPSWAYGAVIYQIFPDRFRNGNPDNDVQDAEYTYGEEYDEGPVPIRWARSWDEEIHHPDVGTFHGGDLAGVLEKLPYLNSLHVDAIYLNPVFVSPSNHKYDVADYEHIDPHLTTGDLETTNEYFADFVAKCHKAGIRVILDGVFNHCSSKHPFFVKALEDPESEYRRMFRFDEDGIPEYWWGVKTLPKFDYENCPELVDYMMGIAAKWVSPPYCCDGWRLDVAPELGHSEAFNHEFWKHFRKAVKEANPEALILAETYDDPFPYLKGDEWDTVMNYRGFMDPVSFWLTGMEKHSDAARPDLKQNVGAFTESYGAGIRELCPEGTDGSALFTALNQLDNHDHSRMITRTNGTIGRLLSAGPSAASEGIRPALYRLSALLQFTLPGCPGIYYGDETALPGWTDPDSRRPFPWGHEDLWLTDFYMYLSALHREKAFRYGSLTMIEGDILLFLREYGTERYLVAVNPGNEGRFLTLPLSELFPGEELTLSRVLGTVEDIVSVGAKKPRPLSDGSFVFTMPPVSGKVYRITRA